jgi:hypothetical protein
LEAGYSPRQPGEASDVASSRPQPQQAFGHPLEYTSTSMGASRRRMHDVAQQRDEADER